MKRLVVGLAVATLIFLPLQVGQVLAAEEMHGHEAHEHAMMEHAEHHHGAEMGAEATQAGTLDISPVQGADGVVELNNKLCPLSNKEVNGKDFLEHDGVRYGLCCKMCSKDFEKSPEKFALGRDVIQQAMTQAPHAS